MADTKVVADIGARFSCPECEYVGVSKHQLAQHRFKVHQVKRVVRSYIDTKFCMFCLQDFSSRQRTIQHIEEGSKRCRLALLTTCRPLENEYIDQLDKRDAAELRRLKKLGHNHRTVLVKVMRLPGPLTQVADMVGIDHKQLLRHTKPFDEIVLTNVLAVQGLTV